MRQRSVSALSSFHPRSLPHPLNCRLSCPKAASRQSRLPQSWHAVGETRKLGERLSPKTPRYLAPLLAHSFIFVSRAQLREDVSVKNFNSPFSFLLGRHEGGVETHPRRGKRLSCSEAFLFLSSACQSQRSLGLANGAAPLERSADPDDDRYRLPALVPRGRRSPGTDPSCSDVYGLRCRARTVCDSAPS